jgi:hypothetical protein
MKLLLLLVAWCVLLFFCWPLALAALVVLPFLWLLSLPFRILSLVVHALLAFLGAVLFLPARLLGWRSR